VACNGSEVCAAGRCELGTAPSAPEAGGGLSTRRASGSASEVEDVEESARMFGILKEMGIRIAIDDFGTGYSSLSYLQRLPIDCLKVDRSFLSGIPRDESHVAITKAIIGMARGLSLEVVCEGVEQEDQLDLLRTTACDHYQGFLTSRPLPEEQCLEFIRRHGNDSWRSGDDAASSETVTQPARLAGRESR
jgi:predicted signal transduction protein with EAL and GGDEF domain